MSSKSAIRTTSFVLGIYAGLLGALHGIFEVMQHNLRPQGLLIQAMGPACQAKNVWHACLPAFTLIPGFLISGIVAILLGICVAVWAAAGLHVERGGLVLMLLSIALFLTGGGFVPLFTGMLAAASAGTYRLPLNGWRAVSPDLLRILSLLFPWALLLTAAWMPGSWLLGHFFPQAMLSTRVPLFLLPNLALPVISVAAAFAHDMTAFNNL